jgi:hypothetical protein
VSLSGAVIADGYYVYDFNVAGYSLASLQAIWTNADAAERLVMNVYARLDDNAAWPSGPTLTAAINTDFRVKGTVGLGVPSQNNAGTLATYIGATRYREMRVEVQKTGAAAGNDTLEIWAMLGSSC